MAIPHVGPLTNQMCLIYLINQSEKYTEQGEI
jgi:hypothetical protein